MSIVNIIKFWNPYPTPNGGILSMHYNYNDVEDAYNYVIDVAYEGLVYRFNISKDILAVSDQTGQQIFSHPRGGSSNAVRAVFDLNKEFRIYGPGAYNRDMMKRILNHAFVATRNPSIKKLNSYFGPRHSIAFAKLILSRVSCLRINKDIRKVIQSVLSG